MKLNTKQVTIYKCRNTWGDRCEGFKNGKFYPKHCLCAEEGLCTHPDAGKESLQPGELSPHCEYNRIPAFCSVSPDCTICDHYHDPIDCSGEEMMPVEDLTP